MSELRRLAPGVAIATVALVVLLAVHRIANATLLAGYALALATIALTGLTGRIAAARRREPSRFEQELTRKPQPPARPSELALVERDIVLGTASAGHFHMRLRPLLRTIAEARTASPRTALAPATWELLRPDAPPPDDAYAPGIPQRRLRDVVDELEQL